MNFSIDELQLSLHCYRLGSMSLDDLLAEAADFLYSLDKETISALVYSLADEYNMAVFIQLVFCIPKMCSELTELRSALAARDSESEVLQ